MAGYSGPAGTNQGNWNGNGGGLGLTTGKTWHGNTAFGPSGGMARGYGSRDMKSLGKAGMGPTPGMYSQFNNLNGNPMFGGALGNQQFRAMNANQAFGMAQNAYNNMQQPPMNPQPAGVTMSPLPRPRPPQPYNPLSSIRVPTPYMPGEDFHLGRALLGGGYNEWSDNGPNPPGFSGQYSAPGKGNFQGGSGAPGKGDFGGGSRRR